MDENDRTCQQKSTKEEGSIFGSILKKDVGIFIKPPPGFHAYPDVLQSPVDSLDRFITILLGPY